MTPNNTLHEDIKNFFSNTTNTSKNDFNKRKCITYMDEFEFILKDNIRTINLVSFSALKDDYINDLEPKWLSIRKKYNFPKGTPIHFTSLRGIFSNVIYTTSDGKNVSCDCWNEEFIRYKLNELKSFKELKKFYEMYSMFEIFSKVNESGLKIIDKEKLINFYEDICECIENSNITILCTSYCYDSKIHYKKYKTIHSNNLKSPYFITFFEHLNLLSFYLKHGHLLPEEKESNPIYKAHFTSKLRCDGDDGFNNKDDYRLAFNEAVTLGTRLFKGNVIRDTIDEIRFVNKLEIGYNNDSPNIVSHIGCDIADFIAYYVGMHILKPTFLKVEHIKNNKLSIAQQLSPEEIADSFENKVTFQINSTLFNPFEMCMKNKIINKNGFYSTQFIKENNFYDINLTS
ncbi:hypothetical protein [Clostridium botulinum]|uniref:hypothetical protein n=1 Tax=Clostridium botulinum TaxID=1491 RepID=UPI0006A43C52|nr:hypothetical protein [Clostridium botulinum]KOC49516.1 hypothetical protein ADU88_05600 [Clostridium botulinum]